MSTGRGRSGARLPRPLTVAPSPVDAPSGQRRLVAHRHVRRDFVLHRLLAGADALAITLALIVALELSNRVGTSSHLMWALLTLPAWIFLFRAYGLYDRDAKRISHTTIDDVPWLAHALLTGCVLLWVYFNAVPVAKLVFGEILLFAASAMVLVLALRVLVRRGYAAALGPERVVLVGEAEASGLLVGKIRAHPEFGLEPIGMIAGAGPVDGVGVLPLLGTLGDLDLETLVGRYRVERVIVAPTALDEEALLELLRRCKELSLKVSVLPQLFDAMGSSVQVDDVEGVTVLGINPPVLSRSSRYLKRAVDVIGATLLLILAAPLMALISLLIKLDSRGPVLFTSERIGRGNRPFRFLKFRTMVPGAEQLAPELRAHSQDPHWLHLADDPRITRVGRFLRMTSLDELPQLWNVLKGEMSLVGPRPLADPEDRQIGGWARSRLDLTPGITGMWQVLGRTNIPFEEMVKLDYLYVTNWSLWTDVRLMIRTLPAVLRRRGAN